MKKTLLTVLIICLLFSIFAIPVLAASSYFFTKAAAYYKHNCTKKNISQSVQISCYLYDKVHELENKLVEIEQKQNNQSQRIDELEAKTNENLAEINALKNKRIITLGQHRGAFFSTTSNIPTPTGSEVIINCSVTCVLFMNYVVDTRNTQERVHNIYEIFLDGTPLSFVNQASFAYAGQAIPLALTGMYPVIPGEHKIQIYVHTNGGELQEHTSTLTVLAVGQ